jgi:PRTRC genetic system ThiF family protein
VELSGETIKTLPIIMSLRNYARIENVLVVGCGGTGGHLIPNLARLIHVLNNSRRSSRRGYSYNHGDLPTIKLFLADGDIVEEKNLIRQHFISVDVGRNKAEVLGERYAAAFGLEIGVIPKYLENLKDFSFLSKHIMRRDAADLVIGCVDNNASRKVLHKWFLLRSNNYSDRASFWIDSGNEERSGQVVCGYKPYEYRYDSLKFNPFGKPVVQSKANGDFSLPCAVEVYPELLHLDDKFSSEVSCADRSASAPQNMQTNVTAATIIMNFVQKLATGDDLKSHCVEFNINNAFNTKLNTVENLKCIAKNRRKNWEVTVK